MKERIPPFVAETNLRESPPLPEMPRTWRFPFFYWGIWFVCLGLGCYFVGVATSIIRLLLLQKSLFVPVIEKLLWLSGMPTTIGIILIALDLGLFFPEKRRIVHRSLPKLWGAPRLTVALTAYNDEGSIALAVKEFIEHPLVKRVIVVSNNSTDRTFERAKHAGA